MPTAKLTHINDQHVDGSFDTLSIFENGVQIDTVVVESSEDETAYIAALKVAGWRVITRDSNEWTVERISKVRHISPAAHAIVDELWGYKGSGQSGMLAFNRDGSGGAFYSEGSRPHADIVLRIPVWPREWSKRAKADKLRRVQDMIDALNESEDVCP